MGKTCSLRSYAVGGLAINSCGSIVFAYARTQSSMMPRRAATVTA